MGAFLGEVYRERPGSSSQGFIRTPARCRWHKAPYKRRGQHIIKAAASDPPPSPPHPPPGNPFLRRKPPVFQENLFARQDGSIKPSLPDRSLFPAWRLVEIDRDRLPGVYQLTPQDLLHTAPLPTGPTSYLIHRQEGQGNVLIDAPDFSESLARQLEGLGGSPTLLIYTNKKRVAGDPRLWKHRFPGLTRVIHTLDVNNPNCTTMETRLEGGGPWQLDPELLAHYTPGNTPGHICIQYSPSTTNSSEQALFSGDHLGYSDSVGSLDGFPKENCYSIKTQGHAIGKLLNVSFSWLLPARGRRVWSWHKEHRRELISTTYWRFARTAHEIKYDSYPLYIPQGSMPKPRRGEIRALPVDTERLPGLLYFISINDVSKANVLGYFLVRAEGKENIMVDCPPYDETLAAQLAAMGGPRLILITHLDGARGQEHQRWKEHFPDSCRMMHGFDLDPSTRFTEMVLASADSNQPVCIGDDVEVHFTPGRTAGHLSVFYRLQEEGVLFSGGMLGMDMEAGHLDAFPEKNAHSLDLQQLSLGRVAGMDFRWLLPTGAGMHHFDDAAMSRASTITRLASALHHDYSRRTGVASALTTMVGQKLAFFRHVDPLNLPGVYEMGYEDDVTASRSYLLELPSVEEKKPLLRVMVDTVVYTPELADQVAKAMGPSGIDLIFFTSRRRASSGEKWAQHFPMAQPVIHALEEATHESGTGTGLTPIELKGQGPWEKFGPGLMVVFTPGMTPGHISIFVRHMSGNRVVCCGDTLAFSEEDQRLDGRASENRCSLLKQYLSMVKLANLPNFRWLLPATGRPLFFTSSEEAAEAVHEAASHFYNTSNDDFTEAHRWAFIRTDVRDERGVPGEPYALPVDEEALPGVYELGYYGRLQGHREPQGYLLQRGNHGELNIMVDTPVYSLCLAEMVEGLGSARLLIHTHRRPANVDSEKWCKRLLGSARMIHTDDVEESTRFVEMKLHGSNASWALNDDILVCTTPGKTPGHVCLRYRPEDGELALFTGGMLAYDGRLARLTALTGSPVHSLDRMQRSLQSMAQAPFQWLLPSCEGGVRFNDTSDGPAQIKQVLDAFESASEKLADGDASKTPAASNRGVVPTDLPGVFSVGSSGYLVAITEARESWLLIDPPAYTPQLVQEIEQRLGGSDASSLTYILYSDASFVVDADHSGWKDSFPGANTVAYHDGDSTAGGGGGGEVDMPLHGPGPWQLTGDVEVQVFHTPGPNPSCLSILLRSPEVQNILFSGRTVGYSPKTGRVEGGKGGGGVSRAERANSLRKLANKDFRWLASGLTYLHEFEDAAERALAFLDAADRLEVED